MRHAVLILLLPLLPLWAVDSVKETTFGLLFRPGLPKEHGRFFTFYDINAETGVDTSDLQDQRYQHHDGGLAVAVNALKRETWVLRAYIGARNRNLTGDFRFHGRDDHGSSRTGLALPNEIQQVAAGVAAKHLLAPNQTLTWRLGVNSSSDKPLNTTDEASLEAEVLYLYAFPKRSALMTGIIWTSRSVYPVPTVAYVYPVNDQLRLTLGVPYFRADWQISKRWKAELGAAPIINDIDASITWQANKWVKAGWTLHQDSWTAYPSERENPDDQLSMRTWRTGPFVFVGHKYAGGLRLETGWGFERKFTLEEKKHLFDDPGYRTYIYIEPGPYLNLTANINF
jgi:hypothetical protein